MDVNSVLYGFMDRVGEDHRIGPAHISLFLAILYYHRKQGHPDPVYVYRKELMKQAKIFAIGTYHKCMRDLQEGNYIRYIPSYNSLMGSLVYLLELKENNYSNSNI
jgi:hypothetical protein